MEQFKGKVWVLGDDIDTDIIIPTEYLALPTVEDMKQYGFSPLRPELAGQIGESGNIDLRIVTTGNKLSDISSLDKDIVLFLS